MYVYYTILRLMNAKLQKNQLMSLGPHSLFLDKLALFSLHHSHNH